MNFDFHKILRLRFEWIKYRHAILKDLDLKLSYFKTEEPVEPDIIVRIGPFNPILSGCKVYEGKTFTKRGFIYNQGKTFRLKWAFQINGLEEDRLLVKMHVKEMSLRGILAPNSFVNILVLPLLELMFLKREYLLLHSAAVGKSGVSYLITGRGGSFKTSITLDLIRKHGYRYMGDDRILINSNAMVLGFPTHLQIFEFLLKNSRSETLDFFTKLKLFRKLVGGEEASIEVLDKASLGGVIFLLPSTKYFTARKLDWETAAKKVMYNMLMENFEPFKILGIDISPVFECITIYSSLHPNSWLAGSRKKSLLLLEKILSKVPIYELFIPFKYNEKIADFVNTYLERF